MRWTLDGIPFKMKIYVSSFARTVATLFAIHEKTLIKWSLIKMISFILYFPESHSLSFVLVSTTKCWPFSNLTQSRWKTKRVGRRGRCFRFNSHTGLMKRTSNHINFLFGLIWKALVCQRDIKDIVMTWMKSLDWRFSGVALYTLNESWSWRWRV